MYNDFKILSEVHGIAGAREKFESLVCELIQREYCNSYGVQVNRGDGGIDTFSGQFAVDMEVYQSKYFIDIIGDTQKNQIRNSYKKAKENFGSSIKKWYLCVPKELTLNEHKWWSNWSSKKIDEDKIDIILYDLNHLKALTNKYQDIRITYLNSTFVNNDQIKKIVLESEVDEDKNMLCQFKTDIKKFVSFIRKHCFAINATHVEVIDYMENFIDDWTMPDMTFDNIKLNKEKVNFVNEMRNLKSYLSYVYLQDSTDEYLIAIKDPDRKSFTVLKDETTKSRIKLVKGYERMFNIL